MSVSMAYDYTCRFCSAVSNAFVALDVAFRANRAASHGDYEQAKKIMLKQQLSVIRDWKLGTW